MKKKHISDTILWTLCGVISVLCIYFALIKPEFISTYNDPSVQAFKTFGLSLILEAIPFLLIGVIISSLISVFLPDDFLKKVIPKNPVLAVLVASLVGILLPLCECGMVPIARGLIKKGLPAYIGITYVIASPIINPIVFSSTLMAFKTQPEVAYYRMLMALVCAVIIGLVMKVLIRSDILKDKGTKQDLHVLKTKVPWGKKIYDAFLHMGEEFMSMGKYLIFGALITAAFQAWIGQGVFALLGNTGWLGNVFMMFFAYVISLCSNTDAFIASTFRSVFDTSAILSFLVFGAMLDFKTTLMLLSSFKKKFVLQLSCVITLVVFIVSILFGYIV